MFLLFLSTISSGLNAVAAVMLQDIIRAFFVKNMTELRATRVSQLLGNPWLLKTHEVEKVIVLGDQNVASLDLSLGQA